MTLLQANGLSLILGTKTIFSDISFTVNKGDRIALVGRNGCGKSSLLRILTGETQADSGIVTKRRGLKIGYAPQELPKIYSDISCYDYLSGFLPEQERDYSRWKVDILLQDIGLPEHQWNNRIQSLSGGWRRLMLIAAATLDEPDLLILDEPTNHLDLGKTLRLEKWLLQLTLPFLIVSHDRSFIDACTNKTLFIRNDGMHLFNASYSIARQNLVEADLLAARQLKKEMAEIDRLERVAARLHDWAGRSNSTALALRSKAIQRRADKITENKTSVYKEEKSDIYLHAETIRAQVLLTVEEKSVALPDSTLLFKTPRWSMRQGDKIALLGLNGAGKSVFIRQIVETFVNSETHPAIKFNPQVKMGYLDQHLDQIPMEKTLYNLIAEEFQLDDTTITRELTEIGFPSLQQHKAAGLLSFGEKARLALLRLRLQKPNFYILDEPTNHLDISGQEMLEEELSSEQQSCIFVSHDRHLVRHTATRFFEIQKKRLVEIDDPDTFFDMLQQMP